MKDSSLQMDGKDFLLERIQPVGLGSSNSHTMDFWTEYVFYFFIFGGGWVWGLYIIDYL